MYFFQRPKMQFQSHHNFAKKISLYAQQYSTNFGVYYDAVDPIIRYTKITKSQLSTLT